jgi:hypothetical protein
MKIVFFLVLALAIIVLAVPVNAVVPVNETVGDYRIRFDAEDNTLGTIGKLWNNSGGDLIGINQIGINQPPKTDPNLEILLNIKEAYFVFVGDANDKFNRSSIAGIIILEKPVNISNAEDLLTNSSIKYVRVYDRTIDNHKAIFTQSGNDSKDPLMTYSGLYWLDENKKGEASKGVLVISTLPWKDGAERFMNSIHVEELPKRVQR